MTITNVQSLKGIFNQDLSWVTNVLGFTTTQLDLSFKNKYGAYARSIRIVNLDTLALLTYKQGDDDAYAKELPARSEVTLTGWEDYVSIIPNGTSGKGYIEFDAIPLEVAKK